LGTQTRGELLHKDGAPITLIISRLWRRATTLTGLTSPIIAALGALIASVTRVASIITAVACAVTVSWAIVAVVIVGRAATGMVATASRTVVTGAISPLASLPSGAAAPTPAPDTSVSTASITLVAVLARILHDNVVALGSAWCIPVSAAHSVTLSSVPRVVEWNIVGIVVESGTAAAAPVWDCLLGLLGLASLRPLGGIEELFDTLGFDHSVGEKVL
jgi:hypothetical protein